MVRLSSSEEKPFSGTVQRLVLMHLGMAQHCKGGDRGPSESDSEEDLSDNMILYYRSFDTGQSGVSDKDSMRTKVQFAGLCSTLYRLSESTSVAEEEVEDQTQVVDFDGNSIVFLALEEPDRQVIAVALISRRSEASHGGTPEAIRSALRRCHQLFCLLRGGGICHRLGNFEGMDEMQQLRKRKCELLERRIILGMLGDGDEAQLSCIQSQISDLSMSLPITSLREDLRVHYDAFLDEFSLTSVDNYAACRCIVECVPSPAPSAFQRYQPQPCTTSPELKTQVERINQSLRTFIRQNNSFRICGVSVFYNDSLLLTEERESYGISNDTAYLLFSYMFNIRSKMQQLCGHDGDKAPSPGTFSPLAFGSDLAEKARTRDSSSGVSSRFMSPPPLSMLSASDTAVDIQGPTSDTRVWAPHISLRRQDGMVKDIRVCLFEASSVLFLLYMSCEGSAAETDDAMFTKSLLAFEDFVTKQDNIQNPDSTITDPLHYLEPGQDIIFIDRSVSSVTVLMKDEPRGTTASVMPTSRLRLFARKRGEGRTDHAITKKSQFDRDCRYRIASKLSLDSLLAFDDAMAELHRRGRNSDNPVELCTLLPNCWIYAHCRGYKELYVFFDPKLYVTVADVHHAASRIWSQFRGC